MTKLEEVARAMFEASIAMCDAQNMPPAALNWDEIPEKLPQDSRPMWLSFARAAIGAMREPSEAMVDSGVAFALNVAVSGEGGWTKYITEKHRAMIDAALNEGEKG